MIIFRDVLAKKDTLKLAIQGGHPRSRSVPSDHLLLTDRVSAAAWRPDGRALAAVDGRGGVCTWRVS